MEAYQRSVTWSMAKKISASSSHILTQNLPSQPHFLNHLSSEDKRRKAHKQWIEQIYKARVELGLPVKPNVEAIRLSGGSNKRIV
jgi:hypothetical protein